MAMGRFMVGKIGMDWARAKARLRAKAMSVPA